MKLGGDFNVTRRLVSIFHASKLVGSGVVDTVVYLKFLEVWVVVGVRNEGLIWESRVGSEGWGGEAVEFFVFLYTFPQVV